MSPLAITTSRYNTLHSPRKPNKLRIAKHVEHRILKEKEYSPNVEQSEVSEYIEDLDSNDTIRQEGDFQLRHASDALSRGSKDNDEILRRDSQRSDQGVDNYGKLDLHSIE